MQQQGNPAESDTEEGLAQAIAEAVQPLLAQAIAEAVVDRVSGDAAEGNAVVVAVVVDAVVTDSKEGVAEDAVAEDAVAENAVAADAVAGAAVGTADAQAREYFETDALRKGFDVETDALEIRALASEYIGTSNEALFMHFYDAYRKQTKDIEWVQRFWFDNPLPCKHLT